MEKRISHFCIALLLATFFIPVAFSQESPVFLFSINSKKIARVGVLNHTSKPVKFYIKNSENEKTIIKVVKENNELFEFMDLSKLSDGLYTACLDGKDVLSKKFFISNGKINKYVKTGLKPRFHLTDNKILFINYFNKYAETFTVKIFDGRNVLLSDISTDTKIAKKYSLSQLLPGSYNIKVVVGQEEFNHSINLQ